MSRYRKIPVAELEVGMYVSELDRPWLETPFLFQGCCVSSDEEAAAGRQIGLKGDEIPVYGRIAGSADTYDAMIASRPYANTQPSYSALRQLRSLLGVEFQSDLLDHFTQAIGIFPTGTLVLLNTGEVAVVTAQSRFRRLRPEVMIIVDAGKQPLADYRLVDLNQVSATADDQISLWIEHGLEPGAYGIDPAEYYLN